MGLLFVLRLLPFFYPDARMWGFNHLIFLPGIYTVIYIIIAALALLLPFLPFTRRWGEIFVNRFSALFFESPRKYVHRLTFIGIMGTLFLLFPMPTHFLGDGYTVIANLSSSAGTFIKWSERGITIILIAIQFLLGPKNQTTALWAFRIVSLLSGMISIWFFFLIARITGSDDFRKTLIFLASFLSGMLLLFFGYAENYPLVWVALTGFTFFAIRYLKENENLLWPTLFLAFGVFIHLEMGIFLPALVYLLFARGKGLRIYRRFTMIFWTVASALLIIGIAIFAWKYQSDIYIENIFLPLIVGKPIYPAYAILSLPHILDILNQMMLLSPLIFILIFAAFKNFRTALKAKDKSFLLLSAIGALMFLTIIDPKLGLPRDWDLFSASALSLTLLLITLFSETFALALKKIMLPLILLQLLSVLPYLAVNLKTQESIAYARYTIDLDINKSYPAYSVMLHYYQDLKDSIQSEELYAKYHPLYVNEYSYLMAEQAIGKGMLSKAVDILRPTTPDRFSWRYHNLLSSLYYAKRDYPNALRESDIAVKLNGYSALLLSNRAKILNAMRRGNEALADLDKAYRLDSHDIDVLEGLTALNLYSGKPLLSIRYGLEMLSSDSLAYRAYYYLTRASATAGQLDRAELNYTKYLKYGTTDSLYERSKSELGKLITDMKRAKRQ